VSTGFRAPALMQQYFSSTRTIVSLVDGVVTVRTFPVNTPEAKLIGATPLRPEAAVNQSAGLVLHVPRLPRITADIYRVSIHDRIGLRASVTDPSLTRLFEENGLAGINGGNYFSNSTDTRTQGVDLIANHAFLLNGSGVLQMLGGFNRTRTVVTAIAPLPPQLARFPRAGFNRTGRGILENGQPRQTITLTLNYTAGPLNLNLHNQHAGPTAQLDMTNPEVDQVVEAKWITDARIAWQVRSRLTVAISGANIFDVYPDETRDFKDGLSGQGISTGGISRYPGALSAFGMNGRTLYLRLAYH
ncbi:MAG: TonB-dependent receptor, partial [Gemmatimonadaceae bacterium]